MFHYADRGNRPVEQSYENLGRVFHNGADQEADGAFYIGPADLMHRNLEERIEAVTPRTP